VPKLPRYYGVYQNGVFVFLRTTIKRLKYHPMNQASLFLAASLGVCGVGLWYFLKTVGS
jgi:hypothetical protein